MNINFGLSDYGRIHFMLKMADLLKLKKKFEIKMAEHPSEAEYYKQKIEETQVKAKELLKNMEVYVQKHKSKGVVAYA